MTRKNIILTTVCFVAVAIAYFMVYRDSFRRPVILISHTHERVRRASNARPKPHPEFVLDHAYRLTAVKVVALDASGTKPDGPPLWELVTKSNSNPIKVFSYGATISGMQPAEPGAHAENLSNNVPYRLLLEAGRVKGQHDFKLTDEDYPNNAVD